MPQGHGRTARPLPEAAGQTLAGWASLGFPRRLHGQCHRGPCKRGEPLLTPPLRGRAPHLCTPWTVTPPGLAKGRGCRLAGPRPGVGVSSVWAGPRLRLSSAWWQEGHPGGRDRNARVCVLATPCREAAGEPVTTGCPRGKETIPRALLLPTAQLTVQGRGLCCPASFCQGCPSTLPEA